jgi:hypothetical protein
LAELATIAQVRSELGIVGNDADVSIARKLEAAEQWIREACGRPLGFVSQEVTETFDGESSGELNLKYTPVATSPTPVVTVGGSVVSSQTYVVKDSGVLAFISRNYGVPPGTYTTNRLLSGVPGLVYNFDNKVGNVTVVYTGGYAAGSIPANLTEAAIALTCQFYRDAGRDFALQSETLGSYSYTIKDGERFSHVLALLGNFVGSDIA